MVYYSPDMIPEILELPLSDRERIIQGLHWAIAEKQKEAIIKVQYYRDHEEEINIPHYEFSDLYNAFSK